jgi:hypothetical protein
MVTACQHFSRLSKIKPKRCRELIDVGTSGGEETEKGEEKGDDDKKTKHDKMEQG